MNNNKMLIFSLLFMCLWRMNTSFCMSRSGSHERIQSAGVPVRAEHAQRFFMQVTPEVVQETVQFLETTDASWYRIYSVELATQINAFSAGKYDHQIFVYDEKGYEFMRVPSHNLPYPKTAFLSLPDWAKLAIIKHCYSLVKKDNLRKMHTYWAKVGFGPYPARW